MNSQNRSRFILVLLLVLLLGGTVWAVRGIKAATKQPIAPISLETVELHRRLSSPEAEKMTPEQRKELWGQMRHLSKDQQHHLRELRHKDEMEKIRKILAMSENERNAAIDAEIARDEAREKAWRKSQEGKTGNGSPDSKGPRGRSGQDGQKGPPGGGDGRPHADREKFRKDMYDRSTPEDRAQQVEFQRIKTERQQQQKAAAGNAPPAKK
jgi:hypothetical protein